MFILKNMNNGIVLRTETKRVLCGGVPIGGGAPVSIQSMTNTDTNDIHATVSQISALAGAGADIVRVAVPTDAAARSLIDIKARLEETGLIVPIVADIHFDYRTAIAAIAAGADKIRINPGNIGGSERLKAVVDAAGAAGIPIRIGVNGGSLEEDLQELYKSCPARALAESALQNIDTVRGMGFEDIVVSVKSSDVLINIEAHRLLAAGTNLPLHIGITEAGFGQGAIVKSASGIGSLLAMGIGDTIRVSLTGDPVQEISVARDILRSVNMLPGQISLVSCPTCGRCHVDLPAICQEVSEALAEVESRRMAMARSIRRLGPAPGENAEGFYAKLAKAESPVTVAIMGCAVNGPGEASHADIGVACGVNSGLYFEKGRRGDTIPAEKIVQTLLDAVTAL